MGIARTSSRLGKITVVLVICCCSLSAQAKYGGGTGEPNDPYQIRDANHMQAIGADVNDWDKCFKLMADIDLSAYTGAQFNVIGYWKSVEDNAAFTGVFDGNGHEISNFTYQSSSMYTGLFGCADNAEIKNLGLRDVNIMSGSSAGSLVGSMQSGTVSNCYVQGGVISIWGYCFGGFIGWNSGYVRDCHTSISIRYRGGTGNLSYTGIGGLIGYNTGTVSNCSAMGDISHGGATGVGGLVGAHTSGTITDCSSSSTLSGGGYYIGGLVGYNDRTIRRCFASGDVSGNTFCGGLVGLNGNRRVDRPSNGRIENSYATGDVSGTSYVGGLVGRQRGDDDGNRSYIIQCYSTGDVTGTDDYVGGLAGENDQSTISNSYSLSSVTGDYMVGGLIGRNYGDIHSRSYVANCYSAGRVTGTTYVGGLVGWHYWNGPTDCFWDVNSSGQATSAGYSGVVGKTTAEMQMQSTFTEAGWDFITPIWDICEGTNYPKLTWQIPPMGDFLCPDGVNFFDYSFFAGHWAEENCAVSNDCDGRDFDLLGSVDINDLRIFVDNWLRGF